MAALSLGRRLLAKIHPGCCRPLLERALAAGAGAGTTRLAALCTQPGQSFIEEEHAGGDNEGSFSRAKEKPRVIILGQPNVGKSTLFNRLTMNKGGRGKGKRAITLNTPDGHVTRDVIEGKASLGDLRFKVFDTAGHNDEAFWQNLEDTPLLENNIVDIVRSELRQSHVALFLLDGRVGVSGADEMLADWLRRNCPRDMLGEGRVKVVLNKCDGLLSRNYSGELEATSAEACKLGFGEPISISAESGEGMAELYDVLRTSFPSDLSATERHERSIRVAITGRPNVGKSTLLNKMVGADRVLTGPKPGLTRDSVEAAFEWDGRSFTLVDTAGRVKQQKQAIYDDMGGEVAGKANEQAEKAVHFAHVVLMVLDVSVALEKDLGHSSLTHFERTMADHAVKHGRPLIVVANKMDLALGTSSREKEEKINAFLQNLVPRDFHGAACIPLSAKSGLGLSFLLPAIADTYDRWCQRIQTSHLNQWLEDLTHFTQVKLVSQMKFVTQVKARPPTFAFFLSGKKKKTVPKSVENFLKNEIRKTFYNNLIIPIRIKFL